MAVKTSVRQVASMHDGHHPNTQRTCWCHSTDDSDDRTDVPPVVRLLDLCQKVIRQLIKSCTLTCSRFEWSGRGGEFERMVSLLVGGRGLGREKVRGYKLYYK